jgi:hypothetical protein
MQLVIKFGWTGIGLPSPGYQFSGRHSAYIPVASYYYYYYYYLDDRFIVHLSHNLNLLAVPSFRDDFVDIIFHASVPHCVTDPSDQLYSFEDNLPSPNRRGFVSPTTAFRCEEDGNWLLPLYLLLIEL